MGGKKKRQSPSRFRDVKLARVPSRLADFRSHFVRGSLFPLFLSFFPTPCTPPTMAIEFQFQSITNSDNTLLVGKLMTVASVGIFAGSSFSYNAIIMPALRKFSSSSSVAIWNETINAAKGMSKPSDPRSCISWLRLDPRPQYSLPPSSCLQQVTK